MSAIASVLVDAGAVLMALCVVAVGVVVLAVWALATIDQAGES